MQLSLMSAFLILSVLFIYTNYDKHQRNIHLVDYCTYNGNWQKAIEIAKSDTAYDVYVNYNYNRAIQNSGIYLEEFFNYPQLIGTDALFPDKLMTPHLTMISSDYYFDLGHIEESEHWANEALIHFPYSLRILKRLIETNIILKNYSGAEKYLNVLSKNFLSGDFTKKYMRYVNDTLLITSDSLIMFKRSCIPDSLHFPSYVVNRFDDLIVKNPNNRYAFENKQLYFMLEHQLGYFSDNLEESLKFYQRMPDVYQEAVLMYNSRANDSNIKNYKISTDVLNKYKYFIEIMNKKQDKEIAKSLLKNYSDTYMYYVLYNSPVVTNYKLTRSFTIAY